MVAGANSGWLAAAKVDRLMCENRRGNEAGLLFSFASLFVGGDKREDKELRYWLRCVLGFSFNRLAPFEISTALLESTTIDADSCCCGTLVSCIEGSSGIGIVGWLIARSLRRTLTVRLTLHSNGRCFTNEPVNGCQPGFFEH